MNSLLQPTTTAHGAYPFDKIQVEDFREAFSLAIEEKEQEIKALIASEEQPTFTNTIVALERSGAKLEWVSGIFFNLLHAAATDELMAISQEITPRLSALSSFITLSDPLFERIRSVWEKREMLGLDAEDLRLLERTYEGFTERGALLPADKKERLKAIQARMSELSLTFSQNNLKDQQRFRLHITDQHALTGMPETSLRSAEALAREEGKSGWVFTLAAPSFFPFMQHCPEGKLREEMYRAKMMVGAASDEYDNRELIRELVNLRLEYAQLLGAKTYAEKALRLRMARTPEAVYQLLDELLTAYRPIAEEELKRVETFAKEHGHTEPLQPWDWSYWAQQYQKAYYELDEEMLRPYFELTKVSEAVLGLATTLYGIHFAPRPELPVYHPDVRAYEVTDADGSYLGLLYTDFFPREGKQSGAWMNNLQEQYHTASGEDHRPHIVLVMNFTPPTEGHPALLTPGEVRTFLHEFGHALHGMFASARYSSLSGTNVVRDFVELPSQLMENWLDERSWLLTFARHYETRETLPEDLIQRMERAKHFLVGYAACRQLSFGYLDMAWHTITEPLSEAIDTKAFEEHAWQRATLLAPSPAPCQMSTSFGHIFSGGYAAGYYGYKWAEVLDADAFAAFQEEGIFSRATAERFRMEVLSQGDKRDAEQLYEAFRGKAPTVDALLRRDGVKA
ncbi:M3 family metallopeptidase [Porphyromonas catoniae]|uniref:M3 family metallopeptidase n=1 Tax=Porphyromonas catoniae TaxID=41976 RepID=UPI0028D6A66B|nr:M3 family metallopeptidase [Porphyromonas catoniae]